MQASQKTLTIVGMGMAGLGCAWNTFKNKANINLVMLEKSQKVGGRVTSSSRQDYIYDHGANYFTFEGLENEKFFSDLIKKQLPTKDLALIPKDLYLFNKDSNIYQSQQVQTSEKWTYTKGVMHLAQLVKEDQNLNVQFEQHVEKLEFNQENKQWTITYIDKKNNSNETKQIQSDFVLLTPPAPQITDLFKKSTYYKKEGVISTFEKCAYKKQIVFVVAFDKKIENLPYFALLNEDRKHDIAWISVEDDKQGHVPQNKSLLVCQMSEAFTELNYNEIDTVLQTKCKQLLEQLIPQINQQNMFDNLKFVWVKRWRYALPNNYQIKQEDIKTFQDDGLFFAGDFLIGKGRVLQAFEKGFIVSDLISQKL